MRATARVEVWRVILISLHHSCRDALGRWQRPQWEEPDFQYLVRQLQYVGYGWLRPEGVRRKLEELAATWQGPSLFTSTQDMAD